MTKKKGFHSSDEPGGDDDAESAAEEAEFDEGLAKDIEANETSVEGEVPAGSASPGQVPPSISQNEVTPEPEPEE